MGPPLDWNGHNARKSKMLDEWRQEQAPRAGADVPQVRSALEHIAREAACYEAWQDNPSPLRLTRGEVRLAQRRAISSMRLALYGPVTGLDAETWWAQITNCALTLGIEVRREDWQQQTETVARAA